MARAKLHAGVGAKVQVRTRFLHPSARVRDQVPNVAIPANHVTVSLTIVRMEEKRVRRQMQQCYVLHHDAYVNDDGSPLELHAVCRNCKVVEEGRPQDFFNPTVPEVPLPPALIEVGCPAEILGYRPGDDPSMIVRNGIEVDDDNQPAPENINPAPEDTNNIYGEWGFPGFCERRRQGFNKHDAKLNHYNGNFDYQSVFEHLFPMAWVKEVLLVKTNDNLDDQKITYGEFLRWIGLWFIMATTEGCQRRDFWASANISMYAGAPYRFNDLMSRSRFEDILQSLQFTDVEANGPLDKFHEIRQLVDCWNKNMAENFRPSYISCLDESMSPWTNPFTCPGYMFVPRKPHPFGNEYHSVACGKSRLMWGIELVEGKDAPAGVPKEFAERGGSTVGLLLRMMKPFFYTGMCLVLDSGFCVLKGLIELRKVGIFAAAVIKKRRYWPKHIDGDAIAAHFTDKAVGDFDVWPGRLENIPFGVYCMKEPDYVMALMATYGSDELCQETQRTASSQGGQTTTHSFRYTELFHNHFAFRNAVDAHNQLRHQPISLEVIWATKRWANRVFAFLLAVTEVNVKLAVEHFGKKDKLPMLVFRKLFADSLINNRNLEQERLGRNVMNLRPVMIRHTLLTVPQFQRHDGRKFVAASTRFPQRQCSECRRKVRTYCACTPSKGMCNVCHTEHILSLTSGDPHGD
jgi:Transposase IS4